MKEEWNRGPGTWSSRLKFQELCDLLVWEIEWRSEQSRGGTGTGSVDQVRIRCLLCRACEGFTFPLDDRRSHGMALSRVT